jgi:hypothetical protein
VTIAMFLSFEFTPTMRPEQALKRPGRADRLGGSNNETVGEMPPPVLCKAQMVCDEPIGFFGIV